MYQKSDTGATVIAVVALIVAILAGVLAWMAYDRTGPNLDTRIQEMVEKSTSDTDTTSDIPPVPIQEAPMEEDTGGDTPSTETQTVPQTQP